MNTSRDIEKLFDHFGGNADDYQEIGRENEARTARTRWPLLATLDFAQPTIPDIAPRAEAQPKSTRPRAPEPAAEPKATPAATPTPILRGRAPLFTRAHRRTIPPVEAPVALSHSLSRFAALDAPVSGETEMNPASPVDVPASAPSPMFGRATPAAPQTREAARAHTPGSTFARRTTATATVTGPSPSPANPATEPPPASSSILGKLFEPQAPAAANAKAGSLDALFDRLRHANAPAPGNESTNTQASVGEAARTSRFFSRS